MKNVLKTPSLTASLLLVPDGWKYLNLNDPPLLESVDMLSLSFSFTLVCTRVNLCYIRKYAAVTKTLTFVCLKYKI